MKKIEKNNHRTLRLYEFITCILWYEGDSLAHSEYAHGHCYSDLYLEPRLDTPYAYVIELKYCPKSSNEKDIDALLDEARVQLPKYINDNHLQTTAKDKGWSLTGIIMVFNGWELARYEVIEH